MGFKTAKRGLRGRETRKQGCALRLLLWGEFLGPFKHEFYSLQKHFQVAGLHVYLWGSHRPLLGPCDMEKPAVTEAMDKKK